MTAASIDTGTHRYRLDRCWDARLPRLVWIMLNPSTADALTNDRTIGRCVEFARTWGFGSITVVNLFAYRATDPDELLGLDLDTAVGEHNDAHILDVIADAGMVVAAWGASVPKAMAGRVTELLSMLGGRELHVLGLTKKGAPRHPLYIQGETPAVVWDRAAA